MNKKLLIVGGVLNALLFLFHVFMGWEIHRIEGIRVEYVGLMDWTSRQ